MTKRQMLKNLIKEALAEVLHDELRTIIKEELRNIKPVVNQEPKKKVNFADFLPGKRIPQKSGNVLLAETLKGNPLASLIQDTAKNLTADEMNKLSEGSGVAEEAIVMPSQGFSQDLGEVEEIYTPQTSRLPF